MRKETNRKQQSEHLEPGRSAVKQEPLVRRLCIQYSTPSLHTASYGGMTEWYYAH